MFKMTELSRIMLLMVCVFALCNFHVGKCEEFELSSPEDSHSEGVLRNSDESSELRKDGKAPVSGGPKKSTSQSSTNNSTRDSQLLSLLAARRRQLLSGRLATHINTIASLAHKSQTHNTTFAQLEVRDGSNSTVKKLTFENSSNAIDVPSLSIVTTDGSKEILKQDVKPHEVRHLFIPKVYQENKSRAGFLNNRRKVNQVNITEPTGIYVPPDDLDVLEKEVDMDPDEDFQVDESNHGIFLLNYSDTDNVNQSITTNTADSIMNSNTSSNRSLIEPTLNITSIKLLSNNSKELNSVTSFDEEKTPLNKPIKTETERDKNTTLFITDELYNHFHPLEIGLPVEEMAPFIYFGQKIGGPNNINDNLTYSPASSLSTKTVNFIISPEKRKFNSRYSATEKYIATEEEEINEDMDVSVVKNVIEKNKIRTSAKGSIPSRNVGLANAYRKQASSSSIIPTEQNTTVAPTTTTRIKNETLLPIEKAANQENIVNETENVLFNQTLAVKLNSTTPQKNYTRTYQNIRRRPIRVTASPSTEKKNLDIAVNTTTEKTSTLVYTAVVTSVSITSSMKGNNKTDAITNNNQTTIQEPLQEKDTTAINLTEITSITPIVTSTFKSTPSSTFAPTSRPSKHRIRIRTTTTESSINLSSKNPSVNRSPAPNEDRFFTTVPVASELTAKNTDLKNEASSSRLSERLANLYRIPTDNSTAKTKNILRRRRPTTTTSTTTSSTTEKPTSTKIDRTTFTTISAHPTIKTSSAKPTEVFEITENTFQPFVVTSKTSSKSSSKSFYTSNNASNANSSSINNSNNTLKTLDIGDDKKVITNEEVVIQAEKTYTASYVLAGLGFLPVAAIIVFVFRNTFNKKTKDVDTEYDGYFDDELKKESPITPVARPPAPPSKPDKKWEFPRNKLRLQTLLGQGNFGQVWKAEADDLTGHDGMTRLVAVKSIKETASQKEKLELLHEIYIMQKIGTHPNVVTLLACCTEQEPYLLLMEYVMCGKLLTYLRERRSRPDRFSGSGTLTSRDLTVFAYCVARGMDYIATKGIVHRDLAARNVLVDHNKLCKIADFGMSREVAGNEEKARQRHALPVRWMAPEALLYNVYNHESDVWAFGILLWEIVTLGSTPYAAMSGREVLTAVTQGYRLERPTHCKPQLYRAMHSCWNADPSQRPTFASLKSQLAELLDNEPAEGNYVDLDSFYQESSVYSDPSAIIHDDEGLSSEYDRERRCFRELRPSKGQYDNRGFNNRDEESRNKFSMSTSRMGGFGIRDVGFNERTFSDNDFSERTFGDNSFNERSFGEPNFVERKDGKLSTSSFHREKRENPLVSRNSFSGFPRIGTRNAHFQILNESRNQRVPEFECDI